MLAFLFLIKGWATFRKGKTGVSTTLLWSAVWGGVILFSLFPSLLTLIQNLVMIKKRMNLVFAIPIFSLLIIAHYQFERIIKLEQKIRKLSQEAGILNYRVNRFETRESGKRKAAGDDPETGFSRK